MHKTVSGKLPHGHENTQKTQNTSCVNDQDEIYRTSVVPPPDALSYKDKTLEMS